MLVQEGVVSGEEAWGGIAGHSGEGVAVPGVGQRTLADGVEEGGIDVAVDKETVGEDAVAASDIEDMEGVGDRITNLSPLPVAQS